MPLLPSRTSFTPQTLYTRSSRPSTPFFVNYLSLSLSLHPAPILGRFTFFSQIAPTVLAAALATLVRLASGADANRALCAQAKIAARTTGLDAKCLQTSLSAARGQDKTSAGVTTSARLEAVDSR